MQSTKKSGKTLAHRWMALITAEQRNARVARWWDAPKATDRNVRMAATNKACNRTEKIAYLRAAAAAARAAA